MKKKTKRTPPTQDRQPSLYRCKTWDADTGSVVVEEWPANPLEVYKDVKGDWRWRLRHANGNVLADSGEGYRNYKDLRTAVANAAWLIFDHASALPMKAPKRTR